MKLARLFRLLLSYICAFVIICLSFVVYGLYKTYVNDLLPIEENQTNVRVGMNQNLHCEDGGSFQRVGFYKNKIGFVCEQVIRHQEDLNEEFKTLIEVYESLDMTNQQLSVVLRRLDNGEFEMVEVWISDTTLLDIACPINQYTVMGDCLVHILVWRKDGYYPFPTYNASLPKHLF